MQHAHLVAASQFHAGTMRRNPGMMPAQPTAHPRTGGYGLFEAQVSAIPDALPSLPWEIGPFKHIFGSDVGVEAPVFRMPVPLAAPETACPPPVPVTRNKAGKRVHACLFHSCVSKRSNEDEMTEDTLWSIALSKWRTIFALTNHQGQVGSMLVDSFWAGDNKSREAIIRDVMGLKAPRTAYKRANELLRCFRFHVDKLGSAWPWDTKSVASYLKTLEGSKGEASATLGLFQAMKFAFHVLDIPFDNSLLADKRMQGRAKRLVAGGSFDCSAGHSSGAQARGQRDMRPGQILDRGDAIRSVLKIQVVRPQAFGVYCV